jgi:hypothetical protein
MFEDDEIEIPAAVMAVLTTNFPDVNPDEVGWSWEVYNKIYEAEFVKDDREYEVEITVTGHHLLTERELTLEEVPEAVMAAALKYFPLAEIGDAELVTMSDGRSFYELNIFHEGDISIEAQISEDGVLLALGSDL